MKAYNLIFSNDHHQRIKRHLLFWTAVFLYHVIRISFLFPPNQLLINPLPILSNSLKWGVITNLIFSYTIIYFLTPGFFDKKKYILFITGILLLYVVLFCLTLVWFDPKMRFAIGTAAQNPYIHLRGTVIRLFGNPPLICGLLLSLRTLKTWHQKQLENEMLTKANASAELQLLKAQIHPHFLFNTLNNIYSFTLGKSPLAPELIQKLSDMLSYMIKDCDKPLVPLEKEIQLLKDYIGLEKVRYGDRLDIQMHVNGDYENKLIVPLLMIPFVENSFKHGASMMRGKQWMQLIIDISDHDLNFNMSNSKPSQQRIIKNKNGIGLINVQKRLELLYPDKHQLIINSTDNAFAVHLKIELKTLHETTKEIAFKNIPMQAVS